jgi:hypothetical protein
MADRIPGTPGGVAQRVIKRNMARPVPENAPYKGDVEVREKLRESLYSKDGWEILVVIMEQVKFWRGETFSRKEYLPAQRLFAIEHVAMYRDLVEKIFQKADLPIPEELVKVLN